MISRGLGDDRGSVVAEFAIALPAVVAVLLLGAGTLGVCAQQVSLQDAAADAARLAARGQVDEARGMLAAAVHGATAAMHERGDLVCITASVAAAAVPIALPVAVTATSCALDGGR